MTRTQEYHEYQENEELEEYQENQELQEYHEYQEYQELKNFKMLRKFLGTSQKNTPKSYYTNWLAHLILLTCLEETFVTYQVPIIGIIFMYYIQNLSF